MRLAHHIVTCDLFTMTLTECCMEVRKKEGGKRREGSEEEKIEGRENR